MSLPMLSCHRRADIDMKRHILALAALAITAVPALVGAQSSGDRAAIQSLIAGQIEAFRRDDGAAAYAAASPGIRSKFPSVEFFMSMVAGAYTPVYRPRSFAFGALNDTAGVPVQRLFLVGPDGLAYVADYFLEREPDGTWKIDGVNIVRDDQPSI
jgi:hypothetical protein